MSWQGCPSPLDLVSILPYILVGIVIVGVSVGFWIWAKQHALNKTQEYN